MNKVIEIFKVFLEKLELIGNIGNTIDGIKTLLILVISALFLFVSVFILYLFNKKSKEMTEKQINEYVNAKKYIPGLFVELDETKEKIRCFCFSTKWRKKIIKKYNTLFADKKGEELLKVYQDEAAHTKLRKNLSSKKLKQECENISKLFERIKMNKANINSDYYDTKFIYECFGDNYRDNIKDILDKVNCIEKKYMILKGTAGNGKSMMLCSVAEMLLANKESVLFFNARNIKGSFLKYMMNSIKLRFIKKDRLYIISFFGKLIINVLKQKNICILIDAFNENIDSDFLETFRSDIEKILFFPKIKMIVSCRSEYFSDVYEKYLVSDKLREKMICLDMQENNISMEACNRMIRNYAKHFNFMGEISEEVKYKISSQLLLVRIFFETYAYSEEKVYELDRHELYKRYIEEIGRKNAVETICDSLADKMLEKKQFENIQLKEIELNENSYEMIDSSILLCRTIIKNADTIMEEKEEVINFVYDEIRDYYLTRKILTKFYENDILDDKGVLGYIKELYEREAICFRGVVNYLFLYYHTEYGKEMQKELIYKYIKPHDIKLELFRTERSQLKSWGILLLLETGDIENEIGKEYVDFILDENPGKEAQKLLTYLIRNEKCGLHYNLDIILYAFIRADEKTLFNRIKNVLSDWRGENICVNDLVGIDKELTKIFESDLNGYNTGVNDLIKIDKELENYNFESVGRFRKLVYFILNALEWKNKKTTMDYFSDKLNESEIQQWIYYERKKYENHKIQ